MGDLEQSKGMGTFKVLDENGLSLLIDIFKLGRESSVRGVDSVLLRGNGIFA